MASNISTHPEKAANDSNSEPDQAKAAPAANLLTVETEKKPVEAPSLKS